LQAGSPQGSHNTGDTKNSAPGSRTSLLGDCLGRLGPTQNGGNDLFGPDPVTEAHYLIRVHVCSAADIIDFIRHFIDRNTDDQRPVTLDHGNGVFGTAGGAYSAGLTIVLVDNGCSGSPPTLYCRNAGYRADAHTYIAVCTVGLV
jgi:hypothetical protein